MLRKRYKSVFTLNIGLYWKWVKFNSCLWDTGFYKRGKQRPAFQAVKDKKNENRMKRWKNMGSDETVCDELCYRKTYAKKLLLG